LQTRINNVLADCLSCDKAGEATLCSELLSLLNVNLAPIVVIDQNLRILWSNRAMQFYTGIIQPADLRSLFIRRIETLSNLSTELQAPHELIRDYGSLGGILVAKIISLSSMPLFGKAHVLALSFEGADNGQAAAKSDVRCSYNIKQNNNTTTKTAECVPIHEPPHSRGEGRC